MPRTRRRLLRTLGATTVGVAVAGCLDGDDGPSDSPTPTDAVAVHVVVDEREVFEVVPELQAAGASDILVTEIERLVP